MSFVAGFSLLHRLLKVGSKRPWPLACPAQQTQWAKHCGSANLRLLNCSFKAFGHLHTLSLAGVPDLMMGMTGLKLMIHCRKDWLMTLPQSTTMNKTNQNKVRPSANTAKTLRIDR